MMNAKQQAGEVVAKARIERGVSWAQIAQLIDKPLVWTVAAVLGMHPLDEDCATAIAERLGLDSGTTAALQLQPNRASESPAYEDPTIYRFQEAVAVYGPALKELIHEEFGDGIMSAINFKVDFSRRKDPGGDRVVVTFDGKFLPYQW
jgi:cyanate lyase